MTTQTIGGRQHLAAAPSRNAGDWLCLAAAPTFALMGLLTAVHGGDPQGMLCAAMQSRSPLNGMVWMYMLMSAFHSAPWLKLIASRQPGASDRQQTT